MAKTRSRSVSTTKKNGCEMPAGPSSAEGNSQGRPIPGTLAVHRPLQSSGGQEAFNKGAEGRPNDAQPAPRSNVRGGRIRKSTPGRECNKLGGKGVPISVDTLKEVCERADEAQESVPKCRKHCTDSLVRSKVVYRRAKSGGPSCEADGDKEDPPKEHGARPLPVESKGFRQGYVHPELFKTCCHAIGCRIYVAGWEKFLHTNKPVYNKLVAEFYTNMSYNDHDWFVKSRVKGVSITITEESLGKALGLPTDGDNEHDLDKLRKFDKYKATMVETKGEKWKGAEVTDRSHLSNEYRVFHNILSHTVTQRSGSYNTVQPYDVYVMVMIRSETPFSLPSLLIKRMITYFIEDRCFLPYANLLTSVFEQEGVDLTNEEATSMNLQSCVGPTTLKQMGLRVGEGGSVECIPGHKKERVVVGNAKQGVRLLISQNRELKDEIGHLKDGMAAMQNQLDKVEEMLKSLVRAQPKQRGARK